MNKQIDEVLNVTFVEERSGWNVKWKEFFFSKKVLTLFWFPVKDIKIPDIFYKIQKFLGMSWASVIVYKELLDLSMWM